jgi:histidyl-tRNA synthetase
MPCVGISFGVDRIFSITKARMEREKQLEAMRASETDVYVMAFGGKGFEGMLPQRMGVCKTLWDAGIKVSRCSNALNMTDRFQGRVFI